MFKRFLVLSLLSLLNSPTFAAGAISTDGSLGAAKTFSGKHITIPQSVGKTVGANLFESFARFSIRNGQTVVFSENTPNALDNIFVRVTGGETSKINGTLQATPDGHANFYLLNPNGFIFGKHATIDVPASFHVSTADELRFANGGVFSTDLARVSQLSAQAPEKYGFLTDRSAEIEFAGDSQVDSEYVWHGTPQIQLTKGSTLDVVGGSVTVNHAQLSSPEGTIRLIAQQGTGKVPFLDTIFSESPSGGALSVRNSKIDVSGNGAGVLTLRASAINLTHSLLSVDNTDGLVMHHVDTPPNSNDSNTPTTGSEGVIPIENDSISPNTGNSNPAPELVLPPNGVAIEPIDLPAYNTGSETTFISFPSNRGLTIQADDLQLNATRLTAFSLGSGQAASTAITASNKLSVLNGSFISSSVLSTGNAGDISVNAKQLRIDAQNSDIFTGIYSTAWRGRGDAGNINLMIADKLSIVRGGIDSITYARGHVGDISLQANQLYIANTGAIASTTVAQGNAGKISVKVNQLTIDGGEKDGFTGITTSAGMGSTGNAGKINLAVSDSLSISNGGQIQNTVFGSGQAGETRINAQHIALNGHGGALDAPAISASAAENSSGQTGDIHIHASKDIVLSDEARISMRNRATIEQPDSIRPTVIDIDTPILQLDAESQITSESFGNIAAGNIKLNISNWLSLQQSLVTTSVSGSNGNGGNITINSPMMVMATGFVQANSAAQNAQGGLININVDALLATGNQLRRGGNTLYPFAPQEFGNNVIQAAAPAGLSGTVDISSPQLNLSGALVNLTITPIDSNQLSNDFCATHLGSSLVRAGQGGMLAKTRDTLLLEE